jgi:hypothetical protein
MELVKYRVGNYSATPKITESFIIQATPASLQIGKSPPSIHPFGIFIKKNSTTG